MNIVGIYHFCFSGKSDNGHYEVHIAKNGPADRWNPKVCLTREERCLQSSVARLVCTACCALEQTNILAKPFRFLHLSRIAMMILVFLLLLSACAACHTCEDPAFERITSTTIIEKKVVCFSGLLVILENSVRNLAGTAAFCVRHTAREQAS